VATVLKLTGLPRKKDRAIEYCGLFLVLGVVFHEIGCQMLHGVVWPVVGCMQHERGLGLRRHVCSMKQTIAKLLAV
jgi:hypothetical protein